MNPDKNLNVDVRRPHDVPGLAEELLGIIGSYWVSLGASEGGTASFLWMWLWILPMLPMFPINEDRVDQNTL